MILNNAEKINEMVMKQKGGLTNPEEEFERSWLRCVSNACEVTKEREGV